MNYFGRARAELAVQLDSRSLSADDSLMRLYTLLVLVKGEDVTLEDVHDAWAAWRDGTKPGHPALVPFADLSPGVAALDEPYAAAIRRAAERL